MKHHTRLSPPAVGGSSLLVIFAVLTLSVFAMLSLTSVQAEKRISDVSARSAVDYYEADRQAEEIFARLRQGENVKGVEITENRYSYRCFISQYQHLSVVLGVEAGQWQILRWQVIASPEPIGKDALPLWKGEEEELHG